MRCAGDWTTAFAKAVGADFDAKEKKGSISDVKVLQPPVGKVLPRVMVDGSASAFRKDIVAS
jgi:NADPH oxidase